MTKKKRLFYCKENVKKKKKILVDSKMLTRSIPVPLEIFYNVKCQNSPHTVKVVTLYMYSPMHDFSFLLNIDRKYRLFFFFSEDYFFFSESELHLSFAWHMYSDVLKSKPSLTNLKWPRYYNLYYVKLSSLREENLFRVPFYRTKHFMTK